MNAQQIFDTVVEHLAAQKVRCANEKGECLYRGPKGRKCAIGCLIPDEVYEPRMERLSPDLIPLAFPEEMRAQACIELMCALQAAHDSCIDAPELRAQLEMEAEEFCLDASKVETITEWRPG